ncbi:MAG: hypothetical protein ACEQSF_00035 [Solirubrobacteraceae bacterium]
MQPTGNETVVNAGININVTGTGTTANPYIINNAYTDPDNSNANELNTGFTSALNTLTIADVGGDKTTSIINFNALTFASNKITSTINGIAAEIAPVSGVTANNETLGFDSTGNLVRGSACHSKRTYQKLK